MAETERQAGVAVPDRFSILLYRISFCGCLLGAIATLYLIGGLSGFVGSALLNVAAAAGISLAALFFLYVLFIQMLDKSRWMLLLWCSILLVLSVEVVLGLVPPTARDELSHHLAMPRLYVRAGRIFEIPFAPYSYYPMLLEMLYVPWVRWGWDSVPKLIHGLFGFLTALLLYAYLARRLSQIYGLLGFFVVIFTPAVIRLSNWAYVDLGTTFYSTASLLCLLRWLEGRDDERWLILAGLSGGFALAAKPNGLLVLLILCFLLAFVLGGEKARGIRQTVSPIFLLLTLAAVSVSPWLLKNLVWTGNPFFPLLGNFFGGGDGGGVSVGGVTGLGILAKRELLYGENVWQMLALPVRVFFAGQDDRAQYFDGVLNPILILFLPWAFKGKWLEEKKLLFAFVLFYFVYALFLTDLRIRYILPIVPPLAILLVYAIHNIYLRIVHPSFLFGVLILLGMLNGIYLWNYSQTVSPLDYLRRNESRDAYLSRMLPEYPAVRYINDHAPSTARIYFLFVGRRVYYCERDYFHDAADYPSVFLQTIRDAKNEEEVEVKLQQRGITHLLVRLDLFLRFLNDNLTRPQKEMLVRFQARYLTLLYHQGGYGVYQVRTGA
ncbi:MAG: glycosyltransferase family 39 protein [Deltaproteobacteria bacterium]|nr:glycosyltransferase family 39 protein [Deltaproteobacteria bacterium]